MQKTKTKTAVAVALVTFAIVSSVAAAVVISSTRKSGGRNILSSGGKGIASVSSRANEDSVTNPIKQEDSTIPATPSPAMSVCGNNTKESGEECDDGNTRSGDGCSGCEMVCTQDVSAEFNSTGSIFLAAAQAAACANAGDCGGSDDFTCKSGQCSPAVCGDGFCNDCSNAFSPCAPKETETNCSQDCHAISPACGNGKLETGEVCDDGNTQSNDGCSATCKKETCRADCSQACKKEETGSPAGVTKLEPGVHRTQELGPLAVGKSRVFSFMHTQGQPVDHIDAGGTQLGFVAVTISTRDWGSSVLPVLMYSGQTCGSRVPTKADVDAIKALNQQANDSNPPDKGTVINGKIFYWNWGGQNSTIYVDGTPLGCYYLYLFRADNALDDSVTINNDAFENYHPTLGTYDITITDAARCLRAGGNGVEVPC